MKHEELAIGLSEEPYVDVGVLSSVIDEYFCRKIDTEQLKGKLRELILTFEQCSMFRSEGLENRTTISARRE